MHAADFRSSEGSPAALTAPRANFRRIASPSGFVGERLGSPSRAAGVGQEEDAVSPVRGADVARAEHAPFRIEPETGQRFENVAESCTAIDAEEASDVFEEEPLGPGGVEDALDMRPQPPLIVSTETLAGDAVALAWHSRDDEIHRSAQRASVEGCQVAPNRRWSQGALFHASRQDRAGVCFPLHVSDGAMRSAQSGESAGDTKVEPSSAGAEGEHADGRKIHTHSLQPYPS